LKFKHLHVEPKQDTPNSTADLNGLAANNRLGPSFGQYRNDGVGKLAEAKNYINIYFAPQGSRFPAREKTNRPKEYRLPVHNK
jgi:hypothetical protein